MPLAAEMSMHSTRLPLPLPAVVPPFDGADVALNTMSQHAAVHWAYAPYRLPAAFFNTHDDTAEPQVTEVSAKAELEVGAGTVLPMVLVPAGTAPVMPAIAVVSRSLLRLSSDISEQVPVSVAQVLSLVAPTPAWIACSAVICVV